MNQAYDVHAGLDFVTVWVDSAVFHNMETESAWVKAKIFGITCLPGRVPTFEILTTEGYVFSDVPPHLVRWKEKVEDPLPLESLVYNNCLSRTFSLAVFPALRERRGYAYFRNEARYVAAAYWFSLDFYQDNNWFHCLKLENGQLAFVPSHKLVFPPDGVLPEGHQFPKFQKLRQEFVV
jgi:hypothetical protein